MIKLVYALTIAAALALSTPAYSAVEEGKAIYNNSCIHCHGVAGAGNLGQDQFWKMKIPRLNQEYVQKKSDEDLSSVILNGKRKMPAAVMGVAHSTDNVRIKQEQIPDLILYIRSLKKK